MAALYTYSEAVSLTKELGKHVNDNTPFSISDKQRIEKLYLSVLGKQFKPTSCQQCYHDALIECYVYLKENKRMAEKSNYRLRAGFIIHNPNFHNGFVYNNDNLTDKVAAEYLEQFPNMKPYFAQLPAEPAEGGDDDGSKGDPDTGTDGEQGGDDAANNDSDNTNEGDSNADSGKKPTKGTTTKPKTGNAGSGKNNKK